MKNCPSCDFPITQEDAIFCTNCGLSLISERQTSVSERMKVWGGEIRMMTVVFVNFNGFERLMLDHVESEILVHLRECLIDVKEIIQGFDGTANYILPDDRVLGIFGAPKAHPDDTFRAVRSAWQIKEWWIRKKQERSLYNEISIRIGINTGRAFFGTVLKDEAIVTVIGDTINTAARLADMCPSNEIAISDSSHAHIADIVEVEHLGERSVKGRKEKVDIYLLKSVKQESRIMAGSKVPFFGRESELGRLLEIAESIQRKQVRLCSIAGQMGIGKTRLKEEFQKRILPDKRFNVIETHCSVDVPAPYFAFNILFRAYFKINDTDTRETIERKINEVIVRQGLPIVIARGVSHLYITDLKRLRQDEMITINEEIYIAVKNLIQFESRGKPLIMIFEEFNRADTMSQYLITYLISELKNEALMFLMVNASKHFAANIDISVDEINLTPLSQQETVGLIRSLLGDIDDIVVDFVYKSAGGNPLFTIEAIRNTTRSQTLKKVKDRWILVKDQRLPFLDDLYGVVMSTIDSLPGTYRLIIDYASVIGYNFSERMLEKITETDGLRDKLNYLVAEGYIVSARTDGEPTYVFRHNLLKDAAYTILPLRKRKEVHRKIADLFEHLFAEQISDYYEAIAHHYLSCESFGKAADYFKLAGDKARNLYAFEQALRFYNNINIIRRDNREDVSNKLMRDVLLGLADIYDINSDFQKMEKAAIEGLESSIEDTDRDYEIQFMERYGYALTMLSNLKKAEEILHAAVDKCNEDMVDMLSILYVDLGALYQKLYEYEKSILHYNMSWNTARSKEIVKNEIICLYNLARLHGQLGNFEKAFNYLDYAAENLITKEEIRWRLRNLYLTGELKLQIWDLEKAQGLFSECLQMADDIGNFEIYQKSGLKLAYVFALQNNIKMADSYQETVDRKIGFVMLDNLLTEINIIKATIATSKRDVNRAIDFATNALKSAQKLRNKEIEVISHIILSEFIEDDKIFHAELALELAEESKMPPLIAQSLYRMTCIFVEQKDLEKARYYGRKALFIYDDIKQKLENENKKTFGLRPEYAQLLEI
ncbi:hypothetical protein A2Y85_08445 [candidate division WOR-3 bacterium RBG_13_43_14]|uniref:Guanylate cyclase domain-containing protein n=1 Tax=candidate division WOR-3 bacterium RBG_13_43_14 TaxID=1802590 RepID=A0A1F4UEA3_UNCW3|nr:MAG: hypothetical protein A2Y85_08445 [candidate division WOR-3 bacterium RBG_13_43_14]